MNTETEPQQTSQGAAQTLSAPAQDDGAATADASQTSASPAVAAWGELSEHHKELFAAKKWDPQSFTPTALLDNYANLEKLVGTPPDQLLKLPASQEIDKWDGWQKLGAPDKPDAYKITPPELPEGVEWDQALEKSIREIGVEAKLLPHQIQALVDGYAGHIANLHNGAVTATGENAQQMQRELRAEWGDKYEHNIEVAKGAARWAMDGMKSEDMQAALDKFEQSVGSANMVKMFAKIGQSLAEDNVIDGNVGPMAGTPAHARAQIEAKKADGNFMKAYTNLNDPGHKAAVQEMTTLHKLATGG